jgi:transmembrane sensor
MKKHTPTLNPLILEEATVWFIDLQDAGDNTTARAGFNEWLRRSPEHVRAFLQVTAFWEDARVLERPADLDRLIEQARTLRDNVVPLDTGNVHVTAAPSVRVATPGRSRIRAYLAAGVLLAGATSLAAWLAFDRGTTFATEIGERRSIPLDDGSVIELNSRSRVEVRFTKDRRTVRLLGGQALFRVAKAPARPFVVLSNDTSVRAVGTEFDVYRKTGNTVVTVVEGRVAVERSGVIGAPASAPSGEILLAAGEQIAVGGTAAPHPEPANILAATAWIDRKLVFDATELSAVVEEFNRYNRQQLRIRDAELAKFHITGTYQATDAAQLIEFLRQRFGTITVQHGNEIEITTRAGPPAATVP